MNRASLENNSLAELILETLRRKELRQSDLARMIGVNRSAITVWVRGRVVPAPRQRARLAHALGVDVGIVEAAVMRAKGGGRPARRILSGHAVAVHPALADALDGLSWEGQEALAKVLQAAKQTKPQ